MATKVNEIIQAAIIRIIMIVLIFILEFPRIGVLRQLVGSRYFAFFTSTTYSIIVLCKISRLYEEKDEK